MSAAPERKTAFDVVGDMDTPLATIRDILCGLAMIAETLRQDGEEGSVVQRLSWIAIQQCDDLERLRGELFKFTHPKREHFERAGWPS